MKTYLLQLLALAGFILLTHTGRAQSSSRKFQFGVKAGANFSQLNDLSYQTPRLDQNRLPVMSGGNMVYDFFQQNDSRSTGLVGGVYARFGNKVYLQPEVLFSVKGGRFDRYVGPIIQQGLETQSVNVKVGTIDLPLLLGVRLGPLRLNAGPMASLTVLNGNLKESLSQYGSQPISQTAKQAQFGYQAGIGLTLAGMQLDLRREASFTNTKTNPTDPTTKASTRSNLWQLTVGFGF